MLSFDLIQIYKNHIEGIKAKELGFHQHVPDEIGGSQILSCTWKGGSELSTLLDIPEPEGVKASTGAMDVGLIWHDYIYTLARNEFLNNPKYKNAHFYFGTEIYPSVVLLKCGLSIVSPIDIAIVQNENGPGFIEIEWVFKDGPKKIWVKHPDAKWIRIWDVKSCSKYSFWKYLDMENLSRVYEGQMQVYMHATNLPSMDVLFINKQTGEMFYKTAIYDDEKWNEIEAIANRKKEIAGFLDEHAKTKNVEIEILDTDFCILQSGDDDFECMYCKLSETHEEAGKDNAPRLVLDRPCSGAYAFIRSKALDMLNSGQYWKRGLSHIEIISINNEMVTSKNKKGTVYEDTLYQAYKNFIKMKIEGKRWVMDEEWIKP